MVRRILYVGLACLLVSLAGCSDDDKIQPEQKTKLVSYLTSTHVPKLVAEENVEEDGNDPFYTVYGDASYRYITDLYNPDRVNWAEVTATSTITITIRAYVFAFTNIVSTGDMKNWTLPFYTNDPELEIFMQRWGTNTEYWTFEPQTVDMSHPNILKAVRNALIGCRQGDDVEIYMTYNLAYDDIYFSIIPRESPIAYFVTIEEVDPA